MKRRAFFGPAALLLAGLAGGAPAAHAADTAVPITGIVSGRAEGVSFSAQPLASSAQAVSAQAAIASGPESVSFSGQALISSRLVPDPDFGRPSLLLKIDLSGLSGVGASTRARYVVSSKELVQRRLAGSHVVVVNFPFTDGAGAAQSAVASFALDFDLNTGAVTNATGTILTPNF